MNRIDDTTAYLLNKPFPIRFYAYTKERFPLLNHGILILSFYSSNQFLAQALVTPSGPVVYNHYSLLGAIILLCIFFHLRVFDDYKDYKEDQKHHPNRLLQKGVITLRELRLLSIAAITIEILISGYRGLAALVSLLCVLLFSLLMLREFFIGNWLRKHFLVYALSHMLIMPLLSIFVFSFTTQQSLLSAPKWFWLYAFVGFFVTFNWEISRKIRAPEDEVHDLGSYSQIFGTYGAAYTVLLVRLIDTALVALVGWYLDLSIWFYLVLIALYLVCLRGFYQFKSNTNSVTAKRMETYAGVYIIAFDVTLALEIVRKYGISVDLL